MTVGKDDRATGGRSDSQEPRGPEPAGASVAVQPTLEIGTILAGKYRIDRMLGRGGMGLVVQAMHLQLQQPVAIKFLLPEVQNATVVQRFMREAQAAVRLRSEHVARVLDVGALEAGTPYIVLEYLEGTDLKGFPRAQLGIGDLIDLVLQACEALTEAHALGIVHRDIKPANLFITSSLGGTPFLKLLDFGISKAWPTSDLTGSQAALGTPAYMSPEQMRSSRGVDHRSDIWSLGVVLYELLQGVKPFESDTLPAVILKVVNDPLPKLTAAMPAGLDAVVYRCLEKDPARRFQSIADLAVALAPYAQSSAQVAITLQRTRSTGGLRLDMAPAPAPEPRAAPAMISTSDPVFSASVTTASRGRRWPIVAVLGTLVGIGLVLLVFVRGEPADPEPSASSPSGATPHAVAPGVASPATPAEPLPGAPLPRDAGLDRAATWAPAVLDGGMLDAPGATPSNDAAILSPHRPTPDDKNRRRGTTERAHATPTNHTTRLNTDRGD
jgi:eukaryotic-like serine/threonine-protein kinase